MTRYHRGDMVTTGDSSRAWTVRSIDGSMANLRDDRGVLCTVPVTSLWLVRSAARWPIRVAAGAVIALAVICISCVWRVASGSVPLDSVTNAILLSVASISVIAWMVVLLRGVWGRL
jgi:hypothetical protein